MAAEASKTLIIAEKPSVAGDLVKALPGEVREARQLLRERRPISSPSPSATWSPSPIPRTWTSASSPGPWTHLPIIPEKFPITALPKTKSQLSTLAKLIRRKDVKEIINACDAGREGELIFRYILQYVSETKPVKAAIRRLWLQSMTKTAIEEGFKHLRSRRGDAEPDAAAMCRSEADWLVGINGSRALTGYKSQWGGFFLTPCGRVQTPTLSMIVHREWDRDKFVPRDYWEVHARIRRAQGEGRPGNTQGRWFDPEFKKNGRATSDGAKPERIWDEARAKEIQAKCQGKPAVVTDTPEAVQPGRALPLRPDQPAARGQRPLRLLAPRTPWGWPRPCTSATRR